MSDVPASPKPQPAPWPTGEPPVASPPLTQAALANAAARAAASHARRDLLEYLRLRRKQP
jgi:hypothetical protein